LFFLCKSKILDHYNISIIIRRKESQNLKINLTVTVSNLFSTYISTYVDGIESSIFRLGLEWLMGGVERLISRGDLLLPLDKKPNPRFKTFDNFFELLEGDCGEVLGAALSLRIGT
jgi:hypothetical protein